MDENAAQADIEKTRQDEILTPRQVEDEGEWPFSRAQLTAWRLMGLGPDFIKGPGKNGRVFYRRSAIERFLDESTVSHGRAA